MLSALAQWLKHEQVSYAIIGGVAIGFVAQPRFTEDIDAVIWLDLDHVASFLESGKAFGFIPRIANPIDFAKKARVLLLRHEQSGIGIDLSCGLLPFEREMLDRSMELTAGTLTFNVATAEDLIILKAIAHRNRDLVDIDNLLNLNPDVDFARIRYWVSQFADALESQEIVGDLDDLLDGYSGGSDT